MTQPHATFLNGPEAPLDNYPAATVTVRVSTKSPDERLVEFFDEGIRRGSGTLFREGDAFVGDVVLWAGYWRATARGRVLTMEEAPRVLGEAYRIPLVDGESG